MIARHLGERSLEVSRATVGRVLAGAHARPRKVRPVRPVPHRTPVVPDCNRPCHRVGPGGDCPACGQPVTITDLIPGNPGDTPRHVLAPQPGK